MTLSNLAIPTQILENDEAEAYVQRSSKILRAARLNSNYPSGNPLARHIWALAPSVHRGVHRGLELDERTGLPTYKSFIRVQTDVAVAEDQLRRLGSRDVLAQKAEGSADIHVRQLKKYDYYQDIVKLPLASLGDMEVRLRKQSEGRAYFHVTLDKLDASGLLMRYTIECSQRNSEADKIATVDQREVAQHTDEFRALIYQFTSLDSSFTFVKLASMAGLEVERVVKGIVGPFYFPWTDTPPALEDFVEKHGFLATFGMDTAAIDVAEERDNDPFSSFKIKVLNQEAQGGYEAAKHRLGYRMFKDRKFVCNASAVPDLRIVLSDLGTKNVVYGIR